MSAKVRGRIDVPADADEESVLDAAKANENVARYLDDGVLRKTIVVPGKLVNLVVG